MSTPAAPNGGFFQVHCQSISFSARCPPVCRLREPLYPERGVTMADSQDTVLVTGATGFIGSHLVERLLESGQRVRCLIRSTSKVEHLRNLGAEFVGGDLRQAETLNECLGGIDLVYHVAGVIAATGRRGFYQGNVQATANLVDAALNVRPPPRRFVYVSSLAAAGPSDDGTPVTEARPARPVSAYGRSKLAGEFAVWRAAGRMPVTVLRPPVVYGPRDRGMHKFFVMAKTGVALHVGHRRRWMSMVHVDDLVRGIVQAAQADVAAGECYFLCDGHGYLRQELAEYVGRAVEVRRLRQVAVPEMVWHGAGTVLDWLAPLRRGPAMLSRDKVREAVQDHWVCSPAKAERQLGWSARIELADGLAATAAWYRENGWL